MLHADVCSANDADALSAGQRWVKASKDTVYGTQPWESSDYGGWEDKVGQVAGGRGFSGACWFFGKELYKRRQYPIGLIWSSIGGSPDEVWMPPDAFAACNARGGSGAGWDLMTAPLLRSVISGVVWYQGESNEAAPLSYNCTFPAMIAAWREEWYNATGGNTARQFPFGFVQLSVHGGDPCYGGKACYNMPTWSEGYAAIRWAQTASYGSVPNDAMPNVFMATAVDIGESRTPAGGPHVRDKEDVGRRLALAYRDNFIRGDGPFYTPGAIAASASALAAGTAAATVVEVAFKNLPPGGAPLLPPTSALGLEVTSETGWNAVHWRNATAASLGAAVNGTVRTIRIESTLARVAQVRYLWSDNACMGWDSASSKRETGAMACPLYTSRNGLPVLPFILNVTA